MRVLVPEALFSSTVLFFVETLVHQALQHRHKLVPLFDPEASPVFGTWCEKHVDGADVVRVALRDGLGSSLRERIDSEVVASDGASDWTASPPVVGGNDLIRLVSSPLVVAVENEVRDARFLDTMAFGVEYDEFARARKEGLITFHHGGGSPRPIIESRADDPVWRHRAWCVFDSDALVSRECDVHDAVDVELDDAVGRGALGAEAGRLIKACRSTGIGHHCLERREAENYLPATVLKKRFPWPDDETRARLDAFGRMGERQRAHFDLKYGFAGDRKASIQHDVRQRVAAHFASVTPDDQRALDSGFGKRIGDQFSTKIPEDERRADGQEPEMTRLFRDLLAWR